MREKGLGDFTERIAKTPVKASVMPWLGQDIGFLHSGEAKDIAGSMEWPPRQFEATTVSHFHELTDNSLKSFVTGVLPSRFLHTGIPVFSRDSVFLGLISDSVSYNCDAGRRAIVRSLLGHPAFTKGK